MQSISNPGENENHLPLFPQSDSIDLRKVEKTVLLTSISLGVRPPFWKHFLLKLSWVFMVIIWNFQSIECLQLFLWSAAFTSLSPSTSAVKWRFTASHERKLLFKLSLQSSQLMERRPWQQEGLRELGAEVVVVNNPICPRFEKVQKQNCQSWDLDLNTEGAGVTPWTESHHLSSLQAGKVIHFLSASVSHILKNNLHRGTSLMREHRSPQGSEGSAVYLLQTRKQGSLSPPPACSVQRDPDEDLSHRG